MPAASVDQKRVPDPLEHELQVAASCHVGAGSSAVFCKSSTEEPALQTFLGFLPTLQLENILIRRQMHIETEMKYSVSS